MYAVQSAAVQSAAAQRAEMRSYKTMLMHFTTFCLKQVTLER